MYEGKCYLVKLLLHRMWSFEIPVVTLTGVKSFSDPWTPSEHWNSKVLKPLSCNCDCKFVGLTSSKSGFQYVSSSPNSFASCTYTWGVQPWNVIKLAGHFGTTPARVHNILFFNSSSRRNLGRKVIFVHGLITYASKEVGIPCRNSSFRVCRAFEPCRNQLEGRWWVVDDDASGEPPRWLRNGGFLGVIWNSWRKVDGSMVALSRLDSTREPSTHLVFDCTDIIQRKLLATLIVLQWEYSWLDDMAMAVGIAWDEIAVVTILTGKWYWHKNSGVNWKGIRFVINNVYGP